MEIDGMWLGLVAATMALVGFLKAKFAWVDGKEEALALALPCALAAVAKWAGCTAAFAQLGWKPMLVGALVAGLVAQYGHDKFLDPVLKPVLSWFHDKFVK